MTVRIVELVEDVPSERLVIRNVDDPVVPLKTRLGCLTFLVVPWLGLTAFYLITHSDRWMVFLFQTCLIHLGAIALIAGVLIRFDRLLFLSVDRSSGRIDFETGVPGTRRHETGTFALDEVASIEGSVGRGFDRTRKFDLPIRMNLMSGSGQSLLKHGIYVKGADTDREMLDFLLRLGSVMGLGHYVVTARDPLNYSVIVAREATESSSPIPQIQAPADYSRDRVEESMVLPDEVVAEFDPSKSIGKGYRVSWQPGREIVIRKGRRALRWIGVLLCTAVGAAAVAFIFDRNIMPLPVRIPTWLLVVIAATGASLAASLLHSISHWFRFDLRTQSVTIRKGLRTTEERLSQISRVELRRWLTGGGSGPEGQPRTSFRHLELSLRQQSGDAIPILEMVTSDYDRSTNQQERIYPFVVALAKQLGKPHGYIESGE